jgi:methylated-DNA-[protein]-cysteine S-methyltransferase
MNSEISVFNTFLGKFCLKGSDGKINSSGFLPDSTPERLHYVHEPYIRQLQEYFAGDRKVFYIPLDIRTTVFQAIVWEAVRSIPYGKVLTYGELAHKLGGNANPRNVGRSNAQNPLCILTPCHRVVGEDFKLVGYAWGLERKRKLLELEGAYRQTTLFS